MIKYTSMYMCMSSCQVQNISCAHIGYYFAKWTAMVNE